ncbi:MAG: hypothetical protein HKN14_15475 [Marinicaulis sp.]|nr:hypothetical protein [Marinicaulis sp.]
MRFETVQTAIKGAGLSPGGAFHLGTDDLPAGETASTIVMLAFGAREWPAFAASPEYQDGRPHRLDRWSMRVVSALAHELDATPYFPFTAPLMPFIRWAQKAEPVYPSEIGMLIHPEFGLWRAWRGALGFQEKIDIPAKDARARPCDTCADKPCLSACPAGAMKGDGVYDVPACGAHIRSPAGGACMDGGCLARRACPVGQGHQYTQEQAAFHMRAFWGQ